MYERNSSKQLGNYFTHNSGMMLAHQKQLLLNQQRYYGGGPGGGDGTSSYGEMQAGAQPKNLSDNMYAPVSRQYSDNNSTGVAFFGGASSSGGGGAQGFSPEIRVATVSGFYQGNHD